MPDLGRIREKIGIGSLRTRYYQGDGNDITEVSDPHTLEDETRRTLMDRLSENKFITVVFLLFFTGVGFLLLRWLGKFGMNVLANELVREGVIALVLLGGAYVVGRRSQLEDIQQMDELILPMEDGLTRFYGYYRGETERSEAPLFAPVKGFTYLGHRAETYTVGDVDENLARMHSAANRDPSDDAVIRLRPNLAQVTHTDTGTVVSQPTRQLKTDPFGPNSTLKTTVPDMAEESVLTDLSEELEKQEKEKQHLRDKITQLERQRNNLKVELQKRREEIVEEIVGTHRELTQAQYKEENTVESEPVSNGHRDGRKVLEAHRE